MAEADITIEKRENLLSKLSEIFVYGKSMAPALLVLLVILVKKFGVIAPK